jgi:putative transposase
MAPHLLEPKLTAARPDTVWPADLADLPTGEGWLYLAAIKDMAPRESVGWSMSDSLAAGAALRLALQRRQPPVGLLHPSDRGVQHAGGEYQKLLTRHGLRGSMSRRGNG